MTDTLTLSVETVIEVTKLSYFQLIFSKSFIYSMLSPRSLCKLPIDLGTYQRMNESPWLTASLIEKKLIVWVESLIVCFSLSDTNRAERGAVADEPNLF